MVAGGLRDRLVEMEAEVEEGAVKPWRLPSPAAWQGPARRPTERPQGTKYKIPRRAPDVGTYPHSPIRTAGVGRA